MIKCEHVNPVKQLNLTNIGEAMKNLLLIATFLTAPLIVGCTSRPDTAANAEKTIKAVPVGALTATLTNEEGVLKRGKQELMLTFTDVSGKTIDVGAVSLNFHMPQMGSMAAMNDAVRFTTTNTPGVYRGKVDIEVGGEWQGQLVYEGPAGAGKTAFSVTAQ